VQPDDNPVTLVERKDRNAGPEHPEGRCDQHGSNEEAHQRVGWPFLNVLSVTLVVAQEAVSGRTELEHDRRDQDHTDELVQREQRAQEEDGHALDGEENEQRDRRRGREPFVSPDAWHAGEGKRGEMSG